MSVLLLQASCCCAWGACVTFINQAIGGARNISTEGNDVYIGDPLTNATYDAAWADIPGGGGSGLVPITGHDPLNPTTWAQPAWICNYTHEQIPEPPWTDYVATVDIVGNGRILDVDTSALGAAPSEASLYVDWESKDALDNWPGDFTVEIRIRSIMFSTVIETAKTQGQLVGTIEIVDGGSGTAVEFNLGPLARAEISTTSYTYLAVFPDYLADPGDPGYPDDPGDTLDKPVDMYCRLNSMDLCYNV